MLHSAKTELCFCTTMSFSKVLALKWKLWILGLRFGRIFTVVEVRMVRDQFCLTLTQVGRGGTVLRGWEYTDSGSKLILPSRGFIKLFLAGNLHMHNID